MLSRLFIAALWSPAEEKDDLLPLVGDVCCILGHVWYLIVSFPDLSVFLTKDLGQSPIQSAQILTACC